MDIQRMLADLNAERNRLDQAISALQGIDSGASNGTVRRGRPPGRPAKTRGRRRMSAEARRRISEAAKARWAKRKGRKATTAKKASSAPAKRGPRGMSAAARKRMSEMMKARWAARKKAAKA